MADPPVRLIVVCPPPVRLGRGCVWPENASTVLLRRRERIRKEDPLLPMSLPEFETPGAKILAFPTTRRPRSSSPAR